MSTIKHFHKPLKYETGEPHGYLMGHPDHPLCVEVEVLENRYFNGPNGEHLTPGTRTWRAESEIEVNRSVFLPITSPEYAEYAKRQAAKRQAKKGSGAKPVASL